MPVFTAQTPILPNLFSLFDVTWTMLWQKIKQELISYWDRWPRQSKVGKKWGTVPMRGGGELGPDLTQCHLGRGLPTYQVAFWSIQPFGHNRHGPKSGWAAVPLSVQGAGSPSNTMSPGLRPTSVPSGSLIHPTIWPQYTNITDRQDNGPIT